MTLDRIRLIAAREARAERGQPDGIVSAATFVATLILVESLAVGPLAASQPGVASALFWIAMAFAATNGTAAAMSGDMAGAIGWAGLLIAFALVYSVLGLTIVSTALE